MAPRGTGLGVREVVFRHAEADSLRALVAASRSSAAKRATSSKAEPAADSRASGMRTTHEERQPSPLAIKFQSLMGNSVKDFALGLAAKAGGSRNAPLLLRPLNEDKMGDVLVGGITDVMLAEAIAASPEFAEDPAGSPVEMWQLLRRKLGLSSGFRKA